MVRMTPKTYSPVRITELLAMQKFHFLLLDVMGFQISLVAVVRILSEIPIWWMPAQATIALEASLRYNAARRLMSQIRVMIT
jgi:hypothetical protein